MLLFQSWAEIWGMHVCSTTTEQRRTTNGPRVAFARLEWEEFKSISNDAIFQSFSKLIFFSLAFFGKDVTCMVLIQLWLHFITASNIKHLEVKLLKSWKSANIPHFYYAYMCLRSCYTNSIVYILACISGGLNAMSTIHLDSKSNLWNDFISQK